MIFHNLRTGILKTFYYLENNNYSNNTGTWNIDFTPSRYWLNHTGEVSVPPEAISLQIKAIFWSPIFQRIPRT